MRDFAEMNTKPTSLQIPLIDVERVKIDPVRFGFAPNILSLAEKLRCLSERQFNGTRLRHFEQYTSSKPGSGNALM